MGNQDAVPTFGVIGAGMSGILAAIKLQEACYPFTVFEKADRVGGTWRENTYPGIACDVPSHLYSYSFDLNPDWSHFCSPGSEIQAYFENAARRYGINADIRFDDPVVRCTWTDERWELETGSGHIETFDWIIAATGILHHPKLPDIDGVETFDGAVFHSARWDHDVPLDGRRIGIVGTGSSGVQLTGALAPRAEKLTVFQRTAQWVVPVEQVAYTTAQKDEFRTDADILRDLHNQLAASFNDGFATSILDAESGMIEAIERRCNEELETIADATLREKLRPDYRAACKRLVVSHNWYDAVQHPSVNLVTDAIEQVEPECAPSMASCTSSTCLCSPPDFTSTGSCGRWRSQDATANCSTTSGRSARAPTWPSPYPTSPTSSCSTDPTARSATSR